MARLPIPGADQDHWGEILNEFLSVAHENDGTVKAATITATAIQDASVSGDKLEDSAITTVKIQDDSVTTLKLQDSSVTTAKLQDDSITGAKLQDSTITGDKLQDASIVTVKLQDDTITDAKLNAGTGTDGQLLTKDSGQASGIKWSSPVISLSLTSFYKSGTLTVTTGVNKLPIDGTYAITGVRLMVGTAPTGADVVVDVKKNGTTVFTTQANRPRITDGQTSGGPGVAPDITALAAGDYLTVDIAQVGSTIAGADLTVVVIVNKVI